MSVRSPSIALFPLGKILFDAEYAQSVADQLYNELSSSGIEVLGSPQILWSKTEVQNALKMVLADEVDLLLVYQATFTDSDFVMEIAKHQEYSIFLWSVPEDWTGGRLRLNSYAGMQLAAHTLHKHGVPFFHIHSEVDNQESIRYLKAVISASQVIRDMRSTRIGVIGDHPSGFESSTFSGAQIKSIFGITIESFSLNDFFERINRISHTEIESTKQDLEKKILNLKDLSQKPVEKTIATYEALLKLQEEYELNAIALRCWPEFFEDFGCAACGAMSLAAERGLACSCEADVLGVITQLLLQKASGNPAQGADLVGFNFKEDTAALWHCGKAPFSMANPKYPLEATSHGNRNLPLLMQFVFKPGPITLARLSQSGNVLQLLVGSAEMLDKPRPFAGTCGVLRFERPANQILEYAISKGMEHHISFSYGSCETELSLLGHQLGIPIIQLGERE